MRHDIRAHFFYATCNLCDLFSPKYYNFRLKLYDCFDNLIDVFHLYYPTIRLMYGFHREIRDQVQGPVLLLYWIDEEAMAVLEKEVKSLYDLKKSLVGLNKQKFSLLSR